MRTCSRYNSRRKSQNSSFTYIELVRSEVNAAHPPWQKFRHAHTRHSSIANRRPSICWRVCRLRSPWKISATDDSLILPVLWLSVFRVGQLYVFPRESTSTIRPRGHHASPDGSALGT